MVLVAFNLFYKLVFSDKLLTDSKNVTQGRKGKKSNFFYVIYGRPPRGDFYSGFKPIFQNLWQIQGETF